MLIQKCQLKFNSFINEKNKRPKITNNSRDYILNSKNKQKTNNLKNHKKTFTSNYINNNNLLKKNKVNKSKNNNKTETIKNNNKDDIINFDRNNKFIEPVFYDYENSNNYINRSNYIIKVKTKINPNEKNFIVKNLDSLNYMDDINMNENIDNNNLSDILLKSKNFVRLQHSNHVARKHITYFKEEHKNFLEKIKFIQLWWKTIFQIIKIQKHLRGFLYRQRLIEELDKEEIAVDNLLFLIKSYKKIVFNIFIFRLRKFKPGIRYYLIKWNEKINKLIIINKLLELYNKKYLKKKVINNGYDVHNTSSDIMKFEYDCDKNYFIRDSTNSLINNIDFINGKYIKNNINDYNICDLDDIQKLSIENYSIKKNKKFYKNNIITSKHNRNTTHLERCLNEKLKNVHNNNNNSCNNNKYNKIKKSKKIKKNQNENNVCRNNANPKDVYKNVLQKNEIDYIKNYNLPNALMLSNNNKITKNRAKNKTNIINTDSSKSGHKNKIQVNSMTGKRFKRNNIASKLVSKEIIPFSMSNNLDNNSDINNLNSLTTLNDNNSNPNKKLKIYENHLHDYQKQNENKNNINTKKKNNNNQILVQKINQSSKIKKDNIIWPSIDELPQINNNPNNYSQNQTELSNNINTISSLNSSLLNSIKNKNSNLNDNNIANYLYFWYQKTYCDIVINKLRSLSLFSSISHKIKKNKQLIFITKLKSYYNTIFISKIKSLFIKYKNNIIKISLNKLYLCKIFNMYKNIVFKKKIFIKLKEYLIKNQNHIYNEIEKDIKNFNKENNLLLNCPRKKVIINNQNQLLLHQNLINVNSNKSMLNLIHPDVGLTQNDNNIEYNYTEENQPFNCDIINKNLIFEQNTDNYEKDIDIDMITKMNQLTMVINLIEQIKIKNNKDNKKKTLNIVNYFNKWKNILNAKKKNNVTGDYTVATDIEEITQNTINDNMQSESELGTKSDHMPYTLSTNSNSKNNNKYIPVRGVKYFQGKIKQKISQNNKAYNINTLIDKYKTSTITTTNENNSQTYNKYDNELTENNLTLNDNFRTFNDYNTVYYNTNNIINNNSNKYLKINNLIQKAKINDIQKNQNLNNIYHRKTVGASIKNNISNNYNNINRINNKIYSNQYTNDSINTTLDNYTGNFLGLLNNISFLGDYKIEPLVLFNNNDNNNNENNNDNNNIINNKYNNNESYDIENLYGFKKLNKIEEREICFFPTNNNNNTNNNKNDNYKYNEDINIVNEIKKYYKEDNDIYNNDIQKKKYNSFIINIFNNNIIMTQKKNTKRSNSK